MENENAPDEVRPKTTPFAPAAAPAICDIPEKGAMAPGIERSKRRRRIIFLGVILVIGFFCPVLVQDGNSVKPVFTNIQTLTSENLSSYPTFMTVQLVWPLAAGAAAIIFALIAGGYIRGPILTLIWLAPLGVMLTDEAGQQMLRRYYQMLNLFGHDWATVLILLTLISVAMLIIAARGRAYRPKSSVLGLFGIAGGLLFIVCLLLPLLPRENGTMFLLMPFKILEDNSVSAQVFGISMLAGFASLLLSAVLCIINFLVRKGSASRGIAVGASVFIVLGILGLWTSRVVPQYILLFQGAKCTVADVSVAILTDIRGTLLFLGFFLLLPVGLADMIVGNVPRAQAAAKTAT